MIHTREGKKVCVYIHTEKSGNCPVPRYTINNTPVISGKRELLSPFLYRVTNSYAGTPGLKSRSTENALKSGKKEHTCKITLTRAYTIPFRECILTWKRTAPVPRSPGTPVTTSPHPSPGEKQ